MTRKLTLKDLAATANVSEMTASRALRNANDVSDATRKRVMEAAAKIGYVPNRIAGALSSNKTDLVGVIIPSVRSYVFSEVLDGISNTLSQTNLRPVFGMTNYDLETEREVIAEMLAWRPSGLIIAGLEHSETTLKILANAATPIVEIMDTDGEPLDACVGISHYQAGFDIAETIVNKGYEKIGFIGTKMKQDFRALKRLNGFKDGLKAHGLTLIDQELYNSGSSTHAAKGYTAALLSRSPQLDCIYCSTDITAMGAYMHCMENDISVPEDLALAGFNNLDVTHGLPVKLATTDSLRYEIGTKAAEIIVKREGKPAEGVEKITLQSNVILGQSL